jgi:hypothetical protein
MVEARSLAAEFEDVPAATIQRCILCGRLATHQASLLLNPKGGMPGSKGLRVELTGALVCALPGCQKPLPGDLLGAMDQVRASVGLGKLWDLVLENFHKAQRGRMPPHYSSTRCAYAPLPKDEEPTADA